ncbi:ABC transporter substrate-binding protein [Brevibacterium sediminis]|uniref:ABC transporter substrate-binding protein n=1 Tax=Brevibacterium sediminis TaxID=1857024 RepID=UPI0021753544|nr:ABC transporter substrate-binding protein [Brevibacterium sediminis]MCS4594585.1 ABC transporter substrate-binding protein [Brevibacterium sediminis]
MEKFRIAATGHSVNYLPEYLGVEFGYFEEEGLSVDAIVPDPWTLVLDEINNGDSQAALGGIWVPSMYRDRGHVYEPFAQVSARCPLVLMAHAPDQEFDYMKTEGTTVLMPGSNGSSPGIFLKFVMTEAGVDVDAVNFVQDLSGAMLAELFSGGMGDYLLIDPVTATRLKRQGVAHIVTCLAESGGPVPWSVYYSDPTNGPSTDAKVGFVRALDRATQWLKAHEASELSGFLERTFPKANPADLVAHVDELRGWGMWETARINAESYARWQQGIADGHLIDKPLEYTAFVDGAIADRARI